MDAIVPGWRAPFAELHRTFVQPLVLRKAKRVLVSSADYARRSSLAGFFANHPQRVVEAPFGVDTDVFCPGPAVRGRFSLPDGVPVLAFVGGLDRAHAFKGLPDLLQAMTSLPEDVQLLIVGDGDLRSSYEEQAEALGLRRRTHFVGRVDVETLRDAYRSADLFVFPSTSRAEAFGLAALEAEACGLPVVASDLPGVRTVVLHGETGLLVPPSQPTALAEAIKRLLDDEMLRQTFSSRASAHARGLSWDAHTDILLKTYRDVCALPS
jgi:glycosyltransferase involved in cell wall biosynthesis